MSAPALAATCPANAIYAIGGSSPQPILAKLGAALSGLATPQTFVYQSSGGSCSGVAAFQTNPPAALTGNGTYWTAAGTATTCAIPPGQLPDFAVATTFATSCPNVTALPSGVADFPGPVQSFEFIVPKASSQTSISAEAGYFLFGFPGGTTYPVSPWTVPTNVITRNNQSGAAIIIALALGVPLSDLTSTTFTVASNSANSLSDVATSTSPESTIGIVSTDVAQSASPGTINILAYQHYGQQCGWTPSSTPGATDQINVRNGHYVPWANIHFLTTVDSSGNIVDPNPGAVNNAANFIGWFTGAVAPPTGIDVDAISIQEGAVIDCAMEVKRTGDLTDLLPYAPAHPCGCYFEKNATGTTSCQACTTSSTCPANAPNCTKGYCEVN